MYPAFETQIGAFVASHTYSEGNSTELFLNHEGTAALRSTKCNSVALCLCDLTHSFACVPCLAWVIIRLAILFNKKIFSSF